MNKASLKEFQRWIRTNRTRSSTKAQDFPRVSYWRTRQRKFEIAIDVFEEYMSKVDD